MASATLFPNAPDVSATDYCVFGLATCFVRDGGEVSQVEVIEPIPSSALEALMKGIPTSYQWASGKNLGDFFGADEITIPAEFPSDAKLCENFAERAVAASRTYKRRPEAQVLIPLGTKKEDFNYSTEKKRVLNAENMVSAEDNVKQHAYTHQVL
ncbi:hypothetical protein K4A83_10880 [Spirulina subsalsa FACHB-351]|uniref:Uncharacterized protein n=1 Tax=Spirulina subsalsa FACHB-351 TaxID=234711 RepID=A0ABT3L6G1_9CYAN|nr:hypothetical protein [Spirulina subsalsa]MCW6036762.1 hypothetical protein [Spirulina subsalsa FACHB-351]